jgi:hypothetical protein
MPETTYNSIESTFQKINSLRSILILSAHIVSNSNIVVCRPVLDDSLIELRITTDQKT